MRQDLGKVPGKPPSLPAPTCSEHTEPSAESGSLQSPGEEQPGISCLKNRRQASTSHLLLAEVQFHVGSEGPGSVSTEASLPWPHCPGLGGHMVSCPPGIQGARSTDPEGRDSQAPTLGLSHLPRACCVQMGVAEAESDCGCCLDRWAVRTPGGLRPHSIRPKRLTSPCTLGSRLRDTRRQGSAGSAHLGSPPYPDRKSPALQGPPAGSAEGCPGSAACYQRNLSS